MRGGGRMATAAGLSCGPSAPGVKPPSVLRPGCCCYMQEIAPVDYWHQAHSSSLGGPRHFGTGPGLTPLWRRVQQTMSSGGMASLATCSPLHLHAETGQNLAGSESRHLIPPGRTFINKSWLSIQWWVCVSAHVISSLQHVCLRGCSSCSSHWLLCLLLH